MKPQNILNKQKHQQHVYYVNFSQLYNKQFNSRYLLKVANNFSRSQAKCKLLITGVRDTNYLNIENHFSEYATHLVAKANRTEASRSKLGDKRKMFVLRAVACVFQLPSVIIYSRQESYLVESCIGLFTNLTPSWRECQKKYDNSFLIY